MAGFPPEDRRVAPGPLEALTGRRPGPQWDEPIPALAAVLIALRRSNHATAFASWTVTTIGLGLIFEVRTLWTGGSVPAALLLTGLLVPVLAATAHVTVLLALAARAAAGGEWRDAGGPLTRTWHRPARSVPDVTAGAWTTLEPAEAVDRLRLLTAAVQRREILAQAALNWSYVAGAAFLAWSLLTTLLSARG